MLIKEWLSSKIIGACFEVHNELGPGLMEHVYENALMREFELLGIEARQQVALPVLYKGYALGIKYIADIIVEDSVILELKSVQELTPLYHKQLLTYLKLSGLKLGFLINFNCTSLDRNNLRRIIN